jgi:hypothetical protein
MTDRSTDPSMDTRHLHMDDAWRAVACWFVGGLLNFVRSRRRGSQDGRSRDDSTWIYGGFALHWPARRRAGIAQVLSRGANELGVPLPGCDETGNDGWQSRHVGSARTSRQYAPAGSHAAVPGRSRGVARSLVRAEGDTLSRLLTINLAFSCPCFFGRLYLS